MSESCRKTGLADLEPVTLGRPHADTCPLLQPMLHVPQWLPASEHRWLLGGTEYVFERFFSRGLIVKLAVVASLRDVLRLVN